MPFESPESVLAIDFGEKRVGVALATLAARLPHPIQTLTNDDNLIASIRQLVDTENVTTIVVGYPRGMSGQSTKQTAVIEAFVAELKLRFNMPIDLQDEALTSRAAEDELIRSNRPYSREDVDALAAAYILNDWLSEKDQLKK